MSENIKCENKKVSITQQIQRNAVALISLLIALSSLGYNTWRNEQTEANRNQRTAAFELLLKLNELELVIFHRAYADNTYADKKSDKGDPRLGWSYVLTIRDLAKILHAPLPQSAGELHLIWNENWEVLSRDEKAVATVSYAIDKVREQTLTLLTSLE